MNDSEFLRDLAARLENGEDCVRLRRIAMDLERPPTDVIFREANNSEARNMKSFVAGFPVTSVAAIVTKEEPLELTADMSIPPGPHSELDVFMQMYNRDLVAEIRGELRNAMENDHDMLKNHNDAYIAEDIQNCTGSYDGIDMELLEAAIAIIRKDPTGVYN
jgi:hypothetical protein